MQVVFGIVDRLGMRFTLLTYETLLHDRIGPRPNLVLADGVDRFNYLGSCILSGSYMSDEVSFRLQEARLKFISL